VTTDVRRFSIGSETLSWLAVAGVGCVEGLFGRTEYLGDWISYLNVSRAVSALDWPAIFNPMWNPGYPILIALARSLAPATPEGEWYAITFLNVIIFLAAYAAWRHLIRSAIVFYRPAAVGMASHPVAVWTTGWLFLGCGLGLQDVSSVSPDLLVMTGFILAAARTLCFIRRRTLSDAIVVGLLLGIGVWVKGIFIPFAGIFLVILFIDCCVRRTGWRPLCTAAAIYVALFACYVAAISSSYGALTFGATGPLNYAFHVDHLPHFTNWQGGPPPFGMPIHPTRQLIHNLPVFEFATPFRATYPPYNDLAYWYQGFHEVYSLQREVVAMGWCGYLLALMARHHPILVGVALALLVSLLRRDWRQAVWTAANSCWPLFLSALLGFGTYFAVMLEDRYIGAFVLIFGLLPLAPLLEPTLARRRLLATALMLIITAAALAELKHVDGETFRSAIQDADFHSDPQWKLAGALASYGLHPGDAVAVVRDTDPPYRCHWAYVSGLRIIAEFGGVPWNVDPRIRTKSIDHPTDPGDVDYGKVFWTQLTSQQRAAVISAFRATGARAVVSLSHPKGAPDPGWIALNNTDDLIYGLAN
jgi:hypothetical protein